MTRLIAIAATALAVLVVAGTYVITQMRGPDDPFAQCNGGAVAGARSAARSS